MKTEAVNFRCRMKGEENIHLVYTCARKENIGSNEKARCPKQTPQGLLGRLAFDAIHETKTTVIITVSHTRVGMKLKQHSDLLMLT